MSVHAIRRRKLGFGLRSPFEGRDFVDNIQLRQQIRLPNTIEENHSAPLATTRLNKNIIAVAHEDGYVNLIGAKELNYLTHWLAHDNAIFDIESYDNRLITASGDTTIRIWDVEAKREVLNFSPHFSTVKSISVYDKNTIASGSRDGSIKIHDLRVENQTVIIIRDAHRATAIRKTRPRIQSKTDPISCVTNVVFDPHSPRLFSAGANDATIKLWDLRKSRPRRSREGHVLFNQPYHEIHHPSQGLHCGYSHLLYSSGRIYASCSDNIIYCYEGFKSTNKPIEFTNYRYSPFLRLAILDDRYLLSGSRAGSGALVWGIKNKHTKAPIGQLKLDPSCEFHDTNVIETDLDSLSVILMRDDGIVCKWTAI